MGECDNCGAGRAWWRIRSRDAFETLCAKCAAERDARNEGRPDTRILLRAIPGGLRVTIEGKSRDKPMTPGQMRQLAIDLLETAERDDIAAELARNNPMDEIPA